MAPSSRDAHDPETVARADIQVLAVVGPTGVGKSALAEQLALLFDGEIVSADSMQVYRGMDVGTAKPSPAERRVPYWCIDVADPGEPFSAAAYQHLAREALTNIAARGRVPILCGGTGLYVRAALDDMRFPLHPSADTSARECYEALARTEGPEAVYALLTARDPGSAALLHPNNTRRVVRALEMHDSGVSYQEQHTGFARRRSLYGARFLGLTMDRAALYERIDARVDWMLAAGLLDEVRELIERGFNDALTASQAIGYKELVSVVKGAATLDEAVASVKLASRRYAKRQMTWFRADPRIRWIDVTDLPSEGTVNAALRALDL
jgi:tRNA dimethylallyltransferase